MHYFILLDFFNNFYFQMFNGTINYINYFCYNVQFTFYCKTPLHQYLLLGNQLRSLV